MIVTERNCQFCKDYKDGYCEVLELKPCYPQDGCEYFSERKEENMNESTYNVTIYFEDDICSTYKDITEFFFTEGSKFFYICDSKGSCEYVSSKKILSISIDPEE